MRFKKLGETYQLRIETADDLAGVLELDESLWVATSAARNVFRCDPKFLELVDADGNGRIYTVELKQAVRWLLDRLLDASTLAEGADTLPLSAIRSDTPETHALVHSARYALESLGKGGSETISLAQVRAFAADMLSRPLNGDGVIRPDAAGDPQTADLIRDVTTCVGGVRDASGRDGVNEDSVGRFMAAVNGYLAWKSRSEIADGVTPAILPLGPDTPTAYSVFQANARKVDEFFTQCRVARFDPGGAARIAGAQQLQVQGAELAGLEGVQAYLEQAPLAPVNPGGTLALSEDAVNPAYHEWVGALKRQVLLPVLGREPESMSESDWRRVKSALAPYAAYLSEKTGGEVETLPLEKLQRYRGGTFHQEALALIEADKRVAALLAGVREVEQLLLYRQDLMRLANNFVSFPELYATDQRALFEVGSLVIDGRWFNFAVRVDNVAAHSAMAKTSHIFTMYLEVSGSVTGEKFTIAVPATAGTKGNLEVGKQGVFFDTKRKAYDARVVQIVPNPISLREALTAPFSRLWDFVAGKIGALSAKTEKGLDAQIDQAAKAAIGTAPAPTAAAPGGGPAGLVVAISLGMAALGSAFAFIMKSLAGLAIYQIALGVIAAVLLVMVPVSVTAICKLRRQDLSALLEGCGWAINARMTLNRAQRRHFTQCPRYPKDAEGAPAPRWVRTLLIAILMAVILFCATWAARALVRDWKAHQVPPAVETSGNPAHPQ